jgi:hypothetical protein
MSEVARYHKGELAQLTDLPARLPGADSTDVDGERSS